MPHLEGARTPPNRHGRQQTPRAPVELSSPVQQLDSRDWYTLGKGHPGCGLVLAGAPPSSLRPGSREVVVLADQLQSVVVRAFRRRSATFTFRSLNDRFSTIHQLATASGATTTTVKTVYGMYPHRLTPHRVKSPATGTRWSVASPDGTLRNSASDTQHLLGFDGILMAIDIVFALMGFSLPDFPSSRVATPSNPGCA